jgi:hypothetical protein
MRILVARFLPWAAPITAMLIASCHLTRPAPNVDRDGELSTACDSETLPGIEVALNAATGWDTRFSRCYSTPGQPTRFAEESVNSMCGLPEQAWPESEKLRRTYVQCVAEGFEQAAECMQSCPAHTSDEYQICDMRTRLIGRSQSCFTGWNEDELDVFSTNYSRIYQAPD